MARILSASDASRSRNAAYNCCLTHHVTTIHAGNQPSSQTRSAIRGAQLAVSRWFHVRCYIAAFDSSDQLDQRWQR